WGVISAASWRGDTCRTVYEQCGRLWSAGILPDYARLLLEIDDPVVKNLLVELDESRRRKGDAEIDSRLADVSAGFERRQREQTIRGRTAALKQGQVSKEDELAVLLELEQHERARQRHQDERARQGISDLTDE